MDIILKNGKIISLKDFQKVNKLKETQLSDHFTVSEFDCEGKLLVAEPLIHFLELLRDVLKRPLRINSGYRTVEYQKRLIKTNKGAATYSPHTVGLAADIDTKTGKETKELAKTILSLAKLHSYKVRVGYKSYLRAGSTFVHLDICPMYYSKGSPYDKEKVPAVWKRENLTW